MLYFYIVQKTMFSTFAINVKWGIIMDKDFENEDDLEKEDKNKYFGRRVAITECIYFAIFMMALFSFVSCKRKGYYTDFHFEIRIYKNFEKEVADTMTLYSSGSYSDIPIVSDFYIKRSQQ